MRPYPKPEPSPKKKRKRIAYRSKKRAAQERRYNAERKEFLKDKICPICKKPATEIHHQNGRENERLLVQKWWLPVTRDCHRWIHDNPLESKKRGF